MSSVVITDKRGGVFKMEITFTYGECSRLPYNSLRKIKADIEQVARGGIKATAEFNIRSSKDSANFVEALDLFGEDGSFVHGSGAEAAALDQNEPPEDEDTSGIPKATAGKARKVKSRPSSAAPSPRATVEADDLEVEDDDELIVEDEAPVKAPGK